MNSAEKLTQRKAEILKEIARLGPMRRGSVTDQFLTSTRRDGSKRKRGPYTVYSFKPTRKTSSRRLRDDKHKALYRQQIDNLRRFERLAAELVQVSEQLADLAVAESGEEKKPYGLDRTRAQRGTGPDSRASQARQSLRFRGHRDVRADRRAGLRR